MWHVANSINGSMAYGNNIWRIGSENRSYGEKRRISNQRDISSSSGAAAAYVAAA